MTDDVNDGEIKEKLADDGLPLSTLAYASGPGYIYHFMNNSKNSTIFFRRNLTDDSLSGAFSKYYTNDSLNNYTLTWFPRNKYAMYSKLTDDSFNNYTMYNNLTDDFNNYTM